LDRRFRLFAGAVKNRTDRTRHVGRGLQQQCRLADARFAAEEHERSGDDAAAEDAIELVDASGKPRVAFNRDLGIRASGARRSGERVAMPAGRGGTLLRALLDQRVPCATFGAAPQPLGRLGAALLADEDGLWLHEIVGGWWGRWGGWDWWGWWI